MAACLTVFFLSLAGFPATAGFLGKFYIFRAAVQSHLVGLTILALLNSVVSVYYYFKIIVAMYMQEGKTGTSDAVLPWAVRVALAASIFGIFWLGLAPNGMIGPEHTGRFPAPQVTPIPQSAIAPTRPTALADVPRMRKGRPKPPPSPELAQSVLSGPWQR